MPLRLAIDLELSSNIGSCPCANRSSSSTNYVKNLGYPDAVTPAICGVRKTLSSFMISLSGGIGSGSKTSSPATISPFFRREINA